jgi:dsRNA-specific ribonuclease
MPQYTEQDLHEALNDIRNGKSLRQASQDWGVPTTTLYNRNKGREPHNIAAQSQQRLSPSQEEHLSN